MNDFELRPPSGQNVLAMHLRTSLQRAEFASRPNQLLQLFARENSGAGRDGLTGDEGPSLRKRTAPATNKPTAVQIVTRGSGIYLFESREVRFENSQTKIMPTDVKRMAATPTCGGLK